MNARALTDAVDQAETAVAANASAPNIHRLGQARIALARHFESVARRAVRATSGVRVVTRLERIAVLRADLLGSHSGCATLGKVCGCTSCNLRALFRELDGILEAVDDLDRRLAG